MIKVGIVGGTGYTGVELLRILAQHPKVKLKVITSRQEAGMAVDELFPSLRKKITLKFSDPSKADLNKCDLVFFATPNGVAMQQARSLFDAGVKIIDLSADFRIKDVAEWEKWYGMSHACPELVAEAIYGLPEVNRASIKNAKLIANPGCYPTAVQLGFLPLIEAKIVDMNQLIADTKSGVSGAGRKAEVHTLFPEAADNFKSYAVPGHRHLPEIKQGLSNIARKQIGLTFVPHLTPMIRGIHATLYATLTKQIDLQTLYADRYANEPFVDVLPAGSHPETRSVRGSNFCRIAVHRPQGGNIAVILSVTDNLVKGAAGQAVQNMNIMFGLPETLGIEHVPLLP
ncbi:MAG TPA: N-acetyl-gamma-glutamyl-phosphate reductase [Nitrosomonas nitrosa]|jgi:N-acetyl-gamma-glutamyl-phosphate reductase|uniref:N-acetyl-gamma-glutamyl-phosphate reductase n=1 Tax=Nitrosomonas nitrosa TaxID=52442 RepID=A0A1I4QVF7_9PROT|nr:N-acetyl-gamma-glutamyl-phosphate reductase [Nitrosomonas nitrosa]MCO6435170.1 N-acetyl-gamma-glutamyl-phosphate reductase [Nitrosomonas nitrosa]PTR03562.1 N-acetyl-gamma-glutamyl-phosphate reductase [Nitrosomonas nitrosa]SFM43775.1 N-acetyl-gamma-glutamyl-phosphate reductase [Nitrosomonas nitrosa]HBZ29448.1 N-acetyl-gamma-glutamyl-phosphate reductase [Nitrosomonas nitrosa]HNP50283.1 N-acetyl-gamma-glutamyl-phosphate reductase [Nitrosomonas nitrosa]